jgi:NADH-quinone oxidoreductase subunit M
MTPYLSLAIWVPIVAGVVVLGFSRDRDAGFARWVALIGAVAGFLVTIPLYLYFDTTTSAMQFVEYANWIPRFDIHYHLGVDGISVLFVLLNSFVTVLVVWAGWEVITMRVAQYMAAFLIMSGLMNAVFAALDGILFYLVFEAMLIPMYLIIGAWGGPNRVYAALKFFLYTIFGSLLMLVALIYLYSVSETFEILAWYQVPLAMSTQILLWVAFFLAFAVKVPMWPIHTWLPDAHVEAPTAGSVVLASIMLKLGTFGFLRLAVPLFPGAAMGPTVRTIVLVLAVIGIVYGALVSLVQPDFKKLVAYSSVSHLGFVMLGIFALTVQSVQGALMVMINHGLSTGALFFLIGMIYERRHTRLIEDYGGIARVVPMFSALLVFVTLTSIGVPGTNGFIGEFLVLIGTFRTFPVYSLVATTVVILAAAYLLWAIQRILFNPLDKPVNEHIPDINRRELALMLPLVAAMLWLGVYPAPVLRRMQPAAEQFVRTVEARASLTGVSTASLSEGR